MATALLNEQNGELRGMVMALLNEQNGEYAEWFVYITKRGN